MKPKTTTVVDTASVQEQIRVKEQREEKKYFAALLKAMNRVGRPRSMYATLTQTLFTSNSSSSSSLSGESSSSNGGVSSNGSLNGSGGGGGIDLENMDGSWLLTWEALAREMGAVAAECLAEDATLRDAALLKLRSGVESILSTYDTLKDLKVANVSGVSADKVITS